MLGTGGTIACVPSENGLVPALDGKTLVKMVPELAGLCHIDYKQILNLDSSNIAPKHWQIIANALAENYDNYDGFVITHGTDTMAYSAAALSWMVRGCKKPVVFTGAQLPITAEGTDAKENVYNAFLVATSQVQGICLTFGKFVIHGLRAKRCVVKTSMASTALTISPWRPLKTTNSIGTLTKAQEAWEIISP